MKGARVRCYLLEPTPLERVSMRVLDYRDGVVCPKGGSHRGELVLGDFRSADRVGDEYVWPVAHPADGDPRWPKACEKCGQAFGADAHRGLSSERIFTRTDTRAIVTLDDTTPGAVWRAPWYEDSPEYRGPDGRCYVVKLPDGHDWIIDSRASNCDSPCRQCKRFYRDHYKKLAGVCGTFEDARPHKCWVRAGTAPAFNVTKGKKGESCTAGGGSIKTSKYHGHFRNGELVSC